MSEEIGILYKKVKFVHDAVPTNETADNNFVPFRNILDEAKADMPKGYTEESKTDTVTLQSGKVVPALYVHSPEVEDWVKWAIRWFGAP